MGHLKRVVVVSLAFLFFQSLVLPFAGASTTVLFTEPSPSETVSGIITVEVKIDKFPDAVGFYLDDLYYSDMTYSGFDGTYWRYTYDLDTWGQSDGAHVLRVNIRSGATSDSRGMTFFVDNYAPSITDLTIKFPSGQEAAKKGDILTLTANVMDKVSGVDQVFCDAGNLQVGDPLLMYDDGKHNDSIEGDGIYGTNPFKVAALTNGYNIAYVTAIDVEGNNATTSIPVAMDNQPPNVISKAIQYPVGQMAVKEGDLIQVVAGVEDKGSGGLLRIGTDIVLVLDNSGSMFNRNPPPIEDLKLAVKNFVDLAHPQDRIAIYAFGNNMGGGKSLWEEAELYMDYTPMNDAGKQQVKDLLDDDYNQFNMGHNTPIWDTIGEGIKYAITSSIHQPVVVAMTDGTDYGYDWYERPDPDWWQNSYNYGYYGLGFERGSEEYAPWHSWGTTVKYTTHYGEYPAPWPDDQETHFFEAPIDDTNVFNYTQQPNGDEDRDSSSGLRKGLLNAPVPVFTIGLGLPHHTPLMANTTEFDLYSIAETSESGKLKGKYYHAPTSAELEDIYEEISFFINLAGDINVTPPGGIKRIVLDASEIGQPIEKPMYDDGRHDDVLEGDETFGSGMMEVKTDVTKVVNLTLDAEDIVSHRTLKDIEVLVDNSPPILEGLTVHLLDAVTGEHMTRPYAMDGDVVYFSVGAIDLGEVSGLTEVYLDATSLGADGKVALRDDGQGWDIEGGDHYYTSEHLAIVTGSVNGFVMVEATAIDIAKNKAVISGAVLMQNAGELMGQVIQPQANNTIFLDTEIRLVVNDITNIEHIMLIIEDNQHVLTTELLMSYNPSLGYYSTVLNTTLLEDGHYYIHGEIWSVADYMILTSEVRALLDNNPPDISIVEPKDDGIILDRSRMLVMVTDKFNGVFSVDNIKSVDHDIDGVGYKAMTRSLSENTWEVWLDPEDLDDGPHEVLVRAKDRSGHTMTKNVTFFMDTMSPTVAPVYVPSKTKSISGDFKFAFAADDPSGIARGELVIGDNKSRWVIPRNPATGLYEFSLDTTQFPDGDTKKYCAVFTDKAGRQESYCSSFKVDNSGVVLPPDQPQKITIIKESEIWPWILVAILAIITFVAAVFVVRERYLRKADMKEMELMRRSRNDEEEEGEGPPSTPLPDDGPVMTGRDDMGKKGDVDGEADGPAKGVRVKVESGKKAKVRVGTYELSALAPEAVGTGAGVAPDVSEGAGQDEAEVKEEGRRRKGPKRFVKCPMCTSKIAVKSDERPLVLSCPTCGAKGRLK